MNAAPWAEKYVGLPFADQGHTRVGVNCWGLVHLVLKHEAGIDVPTYGELSAADLLAAARTFRTDSVGKPWSKVEAPLGVFDVVLMSAMIDMPRARRMPGHVGIMASPTTMLHVWAATNACLMRLEHPRIRHRVLGFYRHQALM